MSEQHRSEPQRPEVNWVQASASALAAVSSAVLLSTLGVAGTIIGAAAGSVVVTVGNSVYAHYLATSKERVAAAGIAAREQAARVRRTRGTASSTSTGNANRTPSQGAAGADDAAERVQARSDQGPSSRALVGRLQWRRIAVAAAGVFALAMGAILTFELITGHAVSTYTGGSDSNDPRTSFGGSSGPETAEPSQFPPGEPASTPTESATDDEATTTSTEEPPTTEPATEQTEVPTTEPPPETPPPTD